MIDPNCYECKKYTAGCWKHNSSFIITEFPKNVKKEIFSFSNCPKHGKYTCPKCLEETANEFNKRFYRNLLTPL